MKSLCYKWIPLNVKTSFKQGLDFTGLQSHVLGRGIKRGLRNRGLRPNGPQAAFLGPMAAFLKRGLRSLFLQCLCYKTLFVPRVILGSVYNTAKFALKVPGPCCWVHPAFVQLFSFNSGIKKKEGIFTSSNQQYLEIHLEKFVSSSKRLKLI